MNWFTLTGSKCPAMICATESLKNKEVKVDYWNTHVGHSVQVEPDELNAAINSVQAEEPVMELLNSIGHDIETGAEVYVTETYEEETTIPHSSSRAPKNVFSIKSKKSSQVPIPETTPKVKNFSFKKDPSKKKESSTYSLASVACGKISANKLNNNKLVSEHSQYVDNNIGNESLVTDDSRTISFDENYVDAEKTNDSVSNESFSKEMGELNSDLKADTILTETVGRFVPIYPRPKAVDISSCWPADKLVPKEYIVSLGEPSVIDNKSEKSLLNKENVSSVNNKGSKSSSKSQSLLKNNSNKSLKSSNSSSSNNSEISLSVPNLKSLGIVAPDSSQIIYSSIPVAQQNLNSLSNIRNTIIPSVPSSTQGSSLTPLVGSTQTYINIDNKLIPVINTSGNTLTSNLGSAVILSSALSQPTAGQSTLLSLPNSKPLSSGTISNYSIVNAVTGKSISTGTSLSPRTSSFPNAPVVLMPTKNSAILSKSNQNSFLNTSSPLVLQTTTASVALTRQKSTVTRNFVSSSSSSVLVPTKASAKPGTISSSFASSNEPISPSLCEKNLSLPTATSSPSSTLKTFSKLACGQPVPSKNLNPVIINSTPVTSTSIMNISNEVQSTVQKPGTFVFESSGELYVLEPLDDDMLLKKNSPSTSTPKKIISETSKSPINLDEKTIKQVKRKCSPVRKQANTTELKKFKIDDKITKKKPYLSKSIINSSDDSSDISIAVKSDNSKPKKDLADVSQELCLASSEDNSKSSTTSENSFRVSSKISSEIKSKDCHVTISNLKEAAKNLICLDKDKCYGETKTTKEKSVSKTNVLKEKSKKTSSKLKNSFPVKTTTPLLTTKTVPSLSIPQSRFVSTFVNSTRTQPSSSPLTSQTCIPSVLPPKPLSEQLSAGTENDSTLNLQNCKSDEEKANATRQLPRIKKGVTIKSVAQEKRCLTDNDLEIMKKVKYYNLEMKYFACQEECKKLKIELVKALSDNKGLKQIIEDSKSNKNGFKEDLGTTNKPLSGDSEADKDVEKITSSHPPPEDKCIVDDSPKTVDLISTVNDRCEDEIISPDPEYVVNGIVEHPEDSNYVKVKNSIDCVDDVTTQESENSVACVDDVTTQESDSSIKNCIKEGNVLGENADLVSHSPEKGPNLATNSAIDIYTMIRTSTLRNLYMDIEDLSREKKKLLDDLKLLECRESDT